MRGRSTIWGILLGSCLLCHGAVTPPPGGGVTLDQDGRLPAPPVVLPPGVPQLSMTGVTRDPLTGVTTKDPVTGVTKSPVVVVVEPAKPITNNVVNNEDSYSLYRNLMDIRHSLEDSGPKTEAEGGESSALRTIKSALLTIMDTIRHSFLKGFLPAAERSRREAEPSKKPYLDGVTYVVGSLLGKQDCSNMIACRAGKFVQTRVPGAQLAVMMMETVIPQSLLTWFGVLKKSVMDRSDQCDNDYDCQLSDPTAPTPTIAMPPLKSGSGQPAPLG